jgi:hypothetical protein
MEALITSYGIDFKSFNDLLIQHKAIIAGSSVLSIYLDNAFVANDIDIWIPCSKKINEFLPIYKSLFKFLCKFGYDDEEINKKEVSSENSTYTNLPTGRYSIVKVIEFYNSENQRIQFIFVDMNPLLFIRNTFDLSVCQTWYDPKTNTINTLDEYYTKDMKMYITYDTDISKLHPKNKARVEKYLSRGFIIIEKPLPILKERDARIFTKEFNIIANNVILLEDINICEYIKQSKNNIVLKVSKSYYAFDRKELKIELSRGRIMGSYYVLTPLRQAIDSRSMENFNYDDYSIFELELTEEKTRDNKHNLHVVKPMSVKTFESLYDESGEKLEA